MRVVLDTNVVLSALLFPRGQLTWLRHLWAAGRIQPLVCSATARELIHALGYPKFKLEEDDIQAVLAAYLPFTETVTMAKRPQAGLPSCRDPHARVFLTLAIAGRAEVLVSGDAAILRLAGRAPFTIETPAEFKKRFG